jgi:hypothetical protein
VPGACLPLTGTGCAERTRRLAVSLTEFVSHPAYGLDELRADLERFVFLLGGSDSPALFGLDQR